MVDILKKIHREIVTLSSEDSFLVEDRTKEFFDYPIHYHPEYELNFILNGKGVRRIIGDSMEEIDDVELVLVGPNLYHVWEKHVCANTKIREVTIQFQIDLFEEGFLHRSVMRPIREMFDRSTHGILFSKEVSLSIKDRVLKVAKMDGMDNFMEMLSILYDLAISRNQRLLSTLTPEPPNLEHSKKIKKLYEFVQQNYARKITLTEAADLVNMSSVSFNRFIKKRTGKTFVDYLNEVRIGYASKFLVERDLAISEIAFICGFNSIANFNRVFKKNKNRTPTKFREDFSGIKRIL